VGPSGAHKQLQQNLSANTYHFYEWSGWQDIKQFLAWLQDHIGVQRLLLEGGPKVNAQFSQRELIDEIYLTIVPVVSAAQGDGPIAPDLSNASTAKEPAFLYQGFSLVSHKSSGDELFCHYQKK
jgi:riboflavin biosynthesis pyrimidine reductase